MQPFKIKEDMVYVNWIIDGILGQSIYPKAKDFDYLYKEGIRAIVSLEDRPDVKKIHDDGFEYLEVPVKDFTAPTIDQLEKINEYIDNMLSIKKPVLVHCFMGGRSGTIAVSYLIHKGIPFDKALEEVRKKVPYAVETKSQIDRLKEYEIKLKIDN